MMASWGQLVRRLVLALGREKPDWREVYSVLEEMLQPRAARGYFLYPAVERWEALRALERVAALGRLRDKRSALMQERIALAEELMAAAQELRAGGDEREARALR